MEIGEAEGEEEVEGLLHVREVVDEVDEAERLLRLVLEELP